MMRKQQAARFCRRRPHAMLSAAHPHVFIKLTDQIELVAVFKPNEARIDVSWCQSNNWQALHGSTCATCHLG